ncbi:hypothetical protein HZA26_01480 [Candidatus Nomurabacteria bacterium]|nr:hypothetical protein [Candidatus Nomurabacteria bacterium]
MTTKYMSQTQYLKILEREIQKINKVIDQKILRGEEYFREARDHRLVLRKIRYHNRRTFFKRFLPLIFQH